MYEYGESGRPPDSRWVGAASVRAPARTAAGRRGRRVAGSGARRPPGPRPVRPGVVAVGVRPVRVEHAHPLALPGGHGVHGRPAAPARARYALLSRRPVAARGAGVRARRALAALALAVVAAAVVVGLGLLAGAVERARADAPSQPPPPVTLTVTVTDEGTVFDLARAFGPERPGAELSAAAERIVIGNSLTSVQLHPGQVLQVPVG